MELFHPLKLSDPWVLNRSYLPGEGPVAVYMVPTMESINEAVKTAPQTIAAILTAKVAFNLWYSEE